MNSRFYGFAIRCNGPLCHSYITGAVDGNRTRLNLIDNQVPYPEDYNGITWKSLGESNPSS